MSHLDCINKLKSNCFLKCNLYFRYRLSPECPFPIPVEDSFAGTEYVLNHFQEYDLNINLDKVFFGGDSAGLCF